MEHVVYKSFTVKWYFRPDGEYGEGKICTAEISIPEEKGAILCGVQVGPRSWPMFITDSEGVNIWIREDIASHF